MNSPITFPVNRRALVRLLAEDSLLQAAERTAEALRGHRTTESLLQQLILCVVEAIPAKRVAMLRPGAKADVFNPIMFHEAPFSVDNTIVGQSIRESCGISVTYPKSVLCAPVGSAAAIYIESDRPDSLTVQHLRLLVVMAAEAEVHLEQAIGFDSVSEENEELRRWAHVDHGLIGNSAAISAVRTFINKVGPSNSTVLINGEMGTGKDLIARALHALSSRSKGPFNAVNCAAMADTLIESELFGHERGAFSGAVAQKKGKIEMANGGTLFLDEIGEMKPEAQAKLLRVIQNREFERVGGTQTLHVDVRIIAATNRNLEEAVAQGLFRGDLFYRLAVINLRPPSLREIRDDIPLLADHILNQLCYLRAGRPVRGISEEALRVMVGYHWPGNVRQLQNVIEQALVLGENEFIEPEDLPEALLAKKPEKSSARGFEVRVLEFKKQIMREAMERVS